MYDILVIGAGPAGIAAAVYGKGRGKDVLVLEKKKVGGLIGSVSSVTHYPGADESETGADFAQRLLDQAERSGVPIRYEEVKETILTPDKKTVKTDKGTYEAKTVIAANGGSGKMLGVEGEGFRGMRLNASADGPNYAGKHVYVIGGADGAVKEALFLSKLAKDVSIVCIEDDLICIPEFKTKAEQTENLHVMPHSSLKAVHGKDAIEELVLVDNNTGEETIIRDPEAGVFVYAGIVPNTGIYPDLELDEAGYILTDDNMETNIPGIFAAGDIRSKKVRQVATAAADGAISGINASAKAK